MKKIIKIGAIVLCFAVFLAACTLLYNKLSVGYENKPKSTVNEKEEKPMARDAAIEDQDGTEVKLLSLIDKPTIVNFWASWCSPCKREMPDFQKTYEKYKDQINFVMINMTDGVRETKEDGRTFIQEQGYTFPTFYDTRQEAARTYSVSSIPTTFFINKEGKIMAKGSGTLREQDIEEAIQQILD
ncbi:MAG: TlpA disulfide reductase family protein [Lachnospiraceae bacterium]